MTGAVRSLLNRAARRVGTDRTARAGGNGPYFFDDVRPEDTYLVSFPRSGNTYLRHLVAALALGRAPTPAEVQQLVPDVHRAASTRRPSQLSPLVAKSHSPPAVVPANVVYLVRDGRAALLSYHRYLGERGHPTPPGVDDMLVWAGVWPCPWRAHVSGWLHHLEDRGRAVVIRYEDLVEDPVAALRRVAQLAGLSFGDDRLERAVKDSSRASMRAAEATASHGSLNFVGTGTASWREAFGPTALCRFEEECADVLVRLGYPLVGPGCA
ncbi:MAG: sulfotransferase domain-containing protein [Acidimicrobiales bacterium]